MKENYHSSKKSATIIELRSLLNSEEDENIKNDSTRFLTGFVESKKSINKNLNSIKLRQDLFTIQCTVEKDNEKLMDVYNELTVESFVYIVGELVSAVVKTTSIKNYEFLVKEIKILSKSSKQLPFVLRDADLPVDEQQSVKFSKCLDHKSYFMRSKIGQSIFRIKCGFINAFRSVGMSKGFVEIVTPKLIGGSSEGGANVFKVDFFGKTACLAQSPQLYKQMAVIGGLRKVLEIGHVYRQEESNVNRYLSEFTGLDLEMESISYEHTINYIYSYLSQVVRGVYKNFSEEIEVLRKYKHFEDVKFGDEPIIYTHKKCIEILKSNKYDVNYADDFSREQEKYLGDYVKNKHDVDFFVIKDYPKAVRAFYTSTNYVDEENSVEYSKSYDFILRGEEILSGAERAADYETLKKSAEDKDINIEGIKGYLESFRFGVPIHSGCGIGLERFLKSLFDYKDIRYFNMFPRDPSRIYP